MLNDISWSQYLAGAGVLLGLYYLAIMYRYYRKETNQLLQLQGEAFPESPPPGEEAARVLSYEELKEVASRIRHGILEEAGKQASKQDLLARIKAVLASYGGLRQPASRVAINHYIIQQAAAICGLVFSEEELERERGTLSETLPRQQGGGDDSGSQDSG